MLSPSKTIVHSKVDSKKDIFQSCVTEQHKKSSLLAEEHHAEEDQKAEDDEDKGRLSSFEVIPDKASQLAESQHF